jgi:hypothetical protein
MVDDLGNGPFAARRREVDLLLGQAGEEFKSGFADDADAIERCSERAGFHSAADKARYGLIQ